MQKYVAKFEAFDSSTLHNLFRENNITVSDLNDMIDKLEKYGLDHVLLKELRGSKERDYRDLRKWKIDSILSRYNKVMKSIEIFETVEDYFLELTDNGYRIKVYSALGAVGSSKMIVLIYTKGVHKSRLDKIAEVSNFLQHLNNSQRLNIELNSIRDSNEFEVTIQTVSGSKKAAQDEDEDYATHRTETEHERALRNLRRHYIENEDENEEDEDEDFTGHVNGN